MSVYIIQLHRRSLGPRRTSRSKRKLDMKNAAGRKGTAEEETYILTSWAKLSTRLTSLEGMISS